MKQPSRKRLQIVTGLGDDLQPILEETSIDNMFQSLNNRSDRIVRDPKTRTRLQYALKKFVNNIVNYFNDSGDLDEYVLTNIITALATADHHGPSDHGMEDYSTFIRKLNPTDPDTDRYFVIGRAGSINAPGCPLKEMERQSGGLSAIPIAKLSMFHAFHHARSKDVTRDAPRIPVEDLKRLIPQEIKSDSILEEAFLDVCFSDGAWELYQLKLAA